MSKYSVPDDQEAEILSRNGINPEDVAVFLRSDDAIYALNLHTRDTIAIYQGDKKW